MVIFNALLDLWDMFYASFKEIYEFMSQTLSEVFLTDNSFIDGILSNLLSALSIGDISLVNLMLGVGLPLLMIYWIASWAIDILP